MLLKSKFASQLKFISNTMFPSNCQYLLEKWKKLNNKDADKNVASYTTKSSHDAVVDSGVGDNAGNAMLATTALAANCWQKQHWPQHWR